MDGGFLLLVFLIAAVGGLLVYAVCCGRSTDGVSPDLAPFSVLPLPDASPDVRAYLELLAGQIAWMDSNVMHSLVLVYGEDDAETAALCDEMRRKYDFIVCMTLPEAKALLENRVKKRNTAP